MRIRYIDYSSVTKKWRKRWKNALNHKFIKEYGIEVLPGIIIIKEFDSSRIVNYKRILRYKLFKLHYPLVIKL